MKIYCYILNWNGARLTLKCVNSICKGSMVPDKIVVVDNGSTDDSVKVLTQNLPSSCILIRSRKNLGYGGGLLHGLNQFDLSESELLWFLNNDTIVQQDTLYQLAQAYCQRGEKSLFSPTIYWADPPARIYYRGYWLNKNTGLFSGNGPAKESSGQEPSPYLECDVIQGSSFLVPTSIVRKYGFMDPSYFLYWEEFDYAYMLKKYDVRSYCVLSAKMYHQVEGSNNVLASSKMKLIRTYYRSRNKIIFWKRHFSFSKCWIYVYKLVANELQNNKGWKEKLFVFLGILHGVLGIRGNTLKIQ